MTYLLVLRQSCVHSFVLKLDMHKDNVHVKSYNKWGAQIATYRRRLCPGILTHSCSGCIKLLSGHLNTTIKWLTNDHYAGHSVVHWHAFSGAGSLSSSFTFRDAHVGVALSCACWLVSSSLCPKGLVLGQQVAPPTNLGVPSWTHLDIQDGGREVFRQVAAEAGIISKDNAHFWSCKIMTTPNDLYLFTSTPNFGDNKPSTSTLSSNVTTWTILNVKREELWIPEHLASGNVHHLWLWAMFFIWNRHVTDV